MDLHDITVNFPKKVELENGKTILIDKEKIHDENLFYLEYPEKYTDRIAINLIKNGFKDATPSIYKGEKYSMSKQLLFPWELHMRLFHHREGNARIYAHVEIARKYFEHLFLIQPAYYEPFKFYSGVYKEFKPVYGPENSIVKKVISNYNVELQPPDNLIEWMPFMEKLYDIFTYYKDDIREILDKIDLEMHKK